MWLKKSNVIFGVFLLSSFLAEAAKLKSYCTLEETSRDVKGVNVEERLPIASVSKVFTSLFAVSSNNLDKKIYTQFFYTQVQPDLFDVHIKGSHEPYFDRSAMQWLISKLNEAGVMNVRKLTFDENFKYYHEANKITRIGRQMINPVSGKDDIDAPSTALVKTQLSQREQLFKNYAVTYKDALQNGVQLSKKIVLKIQKIDFVKSTDYVPPTNSKKGFIASPGLIHMLKLMNWNSNNHAANQIFQYSGGITKFNELFYKNLGLNESQVRFVNGSGQNAMIDGNGRLYNEASCAVVVKTVKALKKSLETQKSKLEDVLAVVGGDVGSTVSGSTYKNALTNLSVIAKTGTVGTNITLAGMISSQTGNHFFFFNVEVNSAPAPLRNKSAWTNAEANRARTIISLKLNELIKKLGGPNPITYKAKFFNLENFEDGDVTEDTEPAQVSSK